MSESFEGLIEAEQYSHAHDIIPRVNTPTKGKRYCARSSAVYLGSLRYTVGTEGAYCQSYAEQKGTVGKCEPSR